jgi:hypothetical protein
MVASALFLSDGDQRGPRRPGPSKAVLDRRERLVLTAFHVPVVARNPAEHPNRIGRRAGDAFHYGEPLDRIERDAGHRLDALDAPSALPAPCEGDQKRRYGHTIPAPVPCPWGPWRTTLAAHGAGLMEFGSGLLVLITPLGAQTGGQSPSRYSCDSMWNFTSPGRSGPRPRSPSG